MKGSIISPSRFPASAAPLKPGQDSLKASAVGHFRAQLSAAPLMACHSPRLRLLLQCDADI
jgi:hypothetical protein